MKKRIMAILLCASMLFSMAACGDGNKDNTEGGKEITEPTLVKLATYDNLDEVFTGDYEVTDEVIAGGFSSMLSNLGVGVEWIEVTDRDTIQEGDIVKLDYTGYFKGEAFEGGAAKDQFINVSKNCGVDETTGASSTSFIDGFTGGLLGSKVGETIKHDVTFPDPYTANPDLAGQITTFEFNIK